MKFFRQTMRPRNSPLWDYFKEATEPANGSLVIVIIIENSKESR